MTDFPDRDAAGAVRVLVLDDQVLVGMDVSAMLEGWGYAPVGPFSRLAQAEEAVATAPPDAAILDVNLGNGETSLPLAHRLSGMGIPFMFLTGYDPSRYDDGTDIVRKAPHMRKPLQERALRDTVNAIVGPRTKR